jgi:hypothetical protein
VKPVPATQEQGGGGQPSARTGPAPQPAKAGG